jgi:hypothetical protein
VRKILWLETVALTAGTYKPRFDQSSPPDAVGWIDQPNSWIVGNPYMGSLQDPPLLGNNTEIGPAFVAWRIKNICVVLRFERRNDCGFAYSVLSCFVIMETKKRIPLLHSFHEIEVGQNSVIAIQT